MIKLVDFDSIASDSFIFLSLLVRLVPLCKRSNDLAGISMYAAN